MKFNHAFDIAFEVISSKEDASDVTPEMVTKAITTRVNQLNSCTPSKLLDAVGVFDTNEVETMSEYIVKWEIQVEAESPLEAARIAREVQLDRNSEALSFEVLHEYQTTHEVELIEHNREVT